MLAPGSTIGIVGSGQLGRMLAIAAAELGYHTHIYSPEAHSPAEEVATHSTVAAYTDLEAFTQFAHAVDVITFEFENIPHHVLAALEARVPVYPSPRLLMISQNRIREKEFARALGIPTAPFARVTSLAELEAAVETLGRPSILKTTECGYDGKGQVKITQSTSLAETWTRLNAHEAVLEGFIEFDTEISVLIARSVHGKVCCYEPVENIHKDHILHTTVVPATITKTVAENAQNIARKIAQASELVGLLAVEMFVSRTGEVIMNEMAPRPHNSGHWTMNACMTSQFEQLVRAIGGLPLGSVERTHRVTMLNIIGDEIKNVAVHLQNPYAKLHLYGKKEARPGRKMGHVNIIEE